MGKLRVISHGSTGTYPLQSRHLRSSGSLWRASYELAPEVLKSKEHEPARTARETGRFHTARTPGTSEGARHGENGKPSAPRNLQESN